MITRIVYVISVCFKKSRYFAFTDATATEIVMPTTFLRALVLLWDARDSFLVASASIGQMSFLPCQPNQSPKSQSPANPKPSLFLRLSWVAFFNRPAKRAHRKQKECFITSGLEFWNFQAAVCTVAILHSAGRASKV